MLSAPSLLGRSLHGFIGVFFFESTVLACDPWPLLLVASRLAQTINLCDLLDPVLWPEARKAMHAPREEGGGEGVRRNSERKQHRFFGFGFAPGTGW